MDGNQRTVMRSSSKAGDFNSIKFTFSLLSMRLRLIEKHNGKILFYCSSSDSYGAS